MNANETIERIAHNRIIAIMRGDFRGRESEIVRTLRDAGVKVIEVTMNSPDAVATIERLAAEFDSSIAIGAGTVLRADEVERVAGAGARFIVSPNRDRAVIEATKRFGLVSLPGCFTPSEIVEALNLGADAVKLFPANALGAGFVRAVRAPLGDVRLIPTGGITIETASDYIRAGAWAIGIGSELVSRDAGADDESLARLAARARGFVRAIASDANLQAQR